jgi:hypothetical protein
MSQPLYGGISRRAPRPPVDSRESYLQIIVLGKHKNSSPYHRDMAVWRRSSQSTYSLPPVYKSVANNRNSRVGPDLFPLLKHMMQETPDIPRA